MPLLSEAYSDARLNLDSLDRDIKSAVTKVRKAAEQMQQALKLDVDVDTSAAERKLDQFAASAAQVKARIEADAAELRVEIDMDAERAAGIGREARQALDAGFGDRPLTLDIDVDYELATFSGRVARQSIEEGFGTDPIVADVTADFDAALFAGRVARDSLEAGVGPTPVQVEVDVDLGSLVTAKGEIDALTRFDNDVKLYLNTTRFDAAYAKVIAKLEALTKKNWTVDLDTNAEAVIDLIEEVIAAAEEADRLKVGVTFDTDGAQAAAEAAREARERFESDPPVIRPDIDLPDPEEFTVRPQVDTTDFDRELADTRRTLDRLTRDTANIRLGVDGEGAESDAVRIRDALRGVIDSIGTFALRPEVQNDEQVLATLAALEAQARRIDGVVARIDVDERGAAATTGKLIALRETVDSIDTSIRYRVSFEGQSEQVIRRSAQRVAAVSARVQADIDAGAAQERTQQAAKKAREEADARFKEALRVEQKLASDILKLRRQTARRGVDLTVREELKATKAKLDEARKRTEVARREAADSLKAFRDADLELSKIRNRQGRSERVESVTVRLEGLARFLVETAAARRARAGLDGTAVVDIDTSGLDDAVASTDRLRDRAARAFGDIGIQARTSARQVREAFDSGGREGGAGFDFSEAAESAQRYFRTLPLLASTAAQRTRAAFDERGRGQGGGFDFTEATENARRYFRSLPLLASTAARRVRRAFDGRDQGSFDFSQAARNAQRYFRTLPLLASTAARRVRSAFGENSDIRVRVTGVSRALADLGKIIAAKVIAARDINIDVDVRGGFSRFGARALSGITTFAARGVQALGSFAAKAGDLFGKVGETIGNAFAQASGAVSDFVANASKQFQQLATKLSAASGPIGAIASALGTAALPAIIVTAITLLAGPIITAVGGLIGGAVAFLIASATAGLVAAGLPIAAILFDENAKNDLKAAILPLKDLLVSEFSDVTNLITTRIVPAFVNLGQQLIPIGARVAESFIVPISNSILNLADSLLPVIDQVTGPMAEGIASVIDLIAKFAPTFGEITLAVGPGLTNAFNAILEVSLRIAGIFSADIGAGFQAIADLLFRLEPALVSAGNAVLPIINFFGELIALFVEAGAMFENTYGPIGDVFDRLTGALPQLQPVIAGITALVVGLIEGFVEFLPVITAIIRLFITLQGILNIVVGVILRVIGIAASKIGDLFDLIFSGLAGFTGALNRLPIIGDLIPDDAQAEIQGFADGISEFVDETDNLGAAALRSGTAMVQLGAGFSVADEATDEARQRIAELNEELRTGQVGISDYLTEMDTLGVKIAPAASKALDNFNKKLEDGSIAGTTLSDTLSSLNEGIPGLSDFLDEENTSIRRALDERGKAVEAELEKLSLIADVKTSEVAGRFQVAELLEGLEPEQVKQFFKEFGDVGSAGFAEAAERIAEQSNANGSIIRNAVADANATIAAELDKLKVVVALSDRGLGNLSEFIESQVDATDIPKIFGEVSSMTEEELRNFNAILGEGQRQAREAAVEEAARQAEIAAEGATLAASRSLEAAQEEWDRLWGEEGIFSSLRGRAAASVGDAPARPGSDTAAGEAGAAFAESFGIGFEGEFATVKTEVIGAAINDLDVGAVDTAQFETAGARLATAIIEGFNSTLNGGIGAGGIFGPTGIGTGGGGIPVLVLAQQITSNVTPFVEAGQTLGGAFVVGAIDGLNVQGVGLSTALTVLAGTLDDNLDAYSLAGATVGQAFVQALTAAIGGGGGGGSILGPVGAAFSPAALAATGVATTIGATTEPFTVAGQALGGALIVGITEGANTDVVTVNGALAVYAAGVGGQGAPWVSAGNRLGKSLIDGIRRAVLGGFAVVAGAARTVSRLLPPAPWTSQGQSLGRDLAAGIAEGALRAAGVVRQASASIAAQLDPGPYLTRGRTLGQALTSGITSGIDAGAGTVSATLRSVVGGTSASGAAFQGGLSVGRAIVSGMTAGINLEAARVYQAAARVASTVRRILEAAFQVRSPSRVTARIGRFVAQGLAVGMLADNSPVAAARVLAGRIIAAASELSTTSFTAPLNRTGERVGAAIADGVRRGFTDNATGLLNGFDLIGSSNDPTGFGRQLVEAMRSAGLSVDYKSDGYWYIGGKRASNFQPFEDQTARIYTPDRTLMARIAKAVAPLYVRSGIGSGVSAQLAPQAASRAAQAQAVYNQSTTRETRSVDQSDRSTVFAPNIYTNDPYALYRKFEEITKRRPS